MYRDGEEQPLRVALQRRAWGSWWMKTEREPAVCSCSSESKWYPGLLGSQLFTRVDNSRTNHTEAKESRKRTRKTNMKMEEHVRRNVMSQTEAVVREMQIC